MSTPTDVEPQASPDARATRRSLRSAHRLAPRSGARSPPRRSRRRRDGALLGLPEKYAATVVGLAFLGRRGSSCFATTRSPSARSASRSAVCSSRSQISPRRIARSALGSARLGARSSRRSRFRRSFSAIKRLLPASMRRSIFGSPASLLDDVSGQLLVIALPEEAFFRGYLQSALDQTLTPRWTHPRRRPRARLAPLGGDLRGRSLLHEPASRARLAVFFPALLFGCSRARTRGVGAGVAFHAACNLFSATLARGYGLAP